MFDWSDLTQTTSYRRHDWKLQLFTPAQRAGQITADIIRGVFVKSFKNSHLYVLIIHYDSLIMSLGLVFIIHSPTFIRS